MTSRYVRVRAAARHLIESAQRRGELRDDVDASGLAIVLLGAVEGTEAQWLVDDTVDWQVATATLRQLILAIGRQP